MWGAQEPNFQTKALPAAPRVPKGERGAGVPDSGPHTPAREKEREATRRLGEAWGVCSDNETWKRTNKAVSVFLDNVPAAWRGPSPHNSPSCCV